MKKVDTLNIAGTDVTRTFQKINGLPQQVFSIQNGSALEPIFRQSVTQAPQNANTGYSISSFSDIHALGNSLENLHIREVVESIKQNYGWNGISQTNGKITTSVQGQALTLS